VERWQPVDLALGSLATLSEVWFDSENQQIWFGGEVRDGAGPLRLADLILFLRARRDRLKVGVSLEPIPGSERLAARYLGGVEDTHLGEVLIESDWQLKVLSTGWDPVDRISVQPSISGFRSLSELTEAYSERRTGRSNRLWIGRPEIVPRWDSENGSSLHFDDWTLRFRAESADGEIAGERSWIAFVEFLQHHEKELRAEFRSLGELHEVSKLAAVADWLWECAPSLSTELLDAGLPLHGYSTPSTVPLIVGGGPSSMRVVGGIALRFSTTYEKALASRSVIPRGPGELKPSLSIDIENEEGRRFRIVALALPSSGVVATPSGRDTNPAFSVPVLRVTYDQDDPRKTVLQLDGQEFEVRLPESCRVTSSDLSIDISFEETPRMDPRIGQPYFPARGPEGVLGFYPHRNAVLTRDNAGLLTYAGL